MGNVERISFTGDPDFDAVLSERNALIQIASRFATEKYFMDTAFHERLAFLDDWISAKLGQRE